MTKMRRYIPLIISFFIIFWVFYGFFIDSYYYKEIILGSFAALFAAIGMHRPEYSRFCKYITALFISATTFASYLTTNNHYIAILGIIFLLMVIAKDLKSLN
ncbi:MAG: hypothetical protein GQ469_03110 [Methanosarcinales archaeon]|nr:hypothetical protein [Methanosarcinales archaeon]